MKDLFSTNPGDYSKYRPSYPQELITFLLSKTAQYTHAWDCGAGSGQLTNLLAPHFIQIDATDISKKQISQAPILPNVTFSIQPAEDTNFPSQYFDIITVAQAIHWFDFKSFYEEVNRVLKPGGLIAVLGYGLVRVDSTINKLIDDFYGKLSSYWEPERKYIDEQYVTIPFPFREIKSPEFQYKTQWTLDHFVHYINTWSAIEKYKQTNSSQLTTSLKESLTPLWNGTKTVTFPTLLRVGYLD